MTPDLDPRDADLIAELTAIEGKLRRFIARNLHSWQDVEDIAQQAYLCLLEVRDPAAVRRPLPFLFGIAARLVADRKKELAPQAMHLQISDETIAGIVLESHEWTTDPASLTEQQQQLEWALRLLPPGRAEVVVLRGLEGFSCSEVASTLKLSIHTVEKYLYEARCRLRKLWGKLEVRPSQRRHC